MASLASLASSIFGPIFIGVMFNIALYGIMIMQTFLYFTACKRDKLWLKCFVAFIFVLDTVNSVFECAVVYIPMIAKYGDINALLTADWLPATDPAMTALTALLVQSFFAWRIHVLTHKWYLVAPVLIFSLGQFLGGVGTAIAVVIVGEWAEFHKFNSVICVWLACAAVADIAITVALVGHLIKNKTGFAATDDKVNRIIRLTIQTGFVTSVCALVDLIVFLASPTSLHFVFNIALCKLYTNSLLSSLNSRTGWRYDTTQQGISEESTAAEQGLHGLNVSAKKCGSARAGVFIDIETVEMRDMSRSGQGGHDVRASSTEPSLDETERHIVKAHDVKGPVDVTL